jgi:hypothetical protein
MSETDRRLKDYLNTHQVNRERMCLELLSVQPDYSAVEPRLPKGGPDGGRDIQGLYKEELCFGAVGFVNDATDTDQHRDQIQKKFKDDLKSSLEVRSGSDKPKVFVFFTNVSLTPMTPPRSFRHLFGESVRLSFWFVGGGQGPLSGAFA